VATAHTRDDQAETVLLRLLRGTGTSGLAGIHRSFNLSELNLSELNLSELDFSEAGSEAAGTEEAPAQPPRLIRPLLSSSRQEIEEFLGSLGQPFRQDASNLDPRFLRNRVRAGLLPGLERDYNPRLREALCETAEIAAAEDAFLDELVSAVVGTGRKLEDGVELELLQKQPLVLQRRILRGLCRAHSLALSFAQIEALREFALAGHAGRINLVRGFAAEVVRAKFLPARLCLLPKQQAQPGSETYCFELPIPGTVFLSEIWREPAMSIRATLLDRTAAVAMYNRGDLLSSERVGAHLTIRNLCPGDRFRPLYSNGERKVNRLLQELSIPAALRRRWPVALAGGRIVWVPGLPVASYAAWIPGDGEAALVETCNGEDAILNDSAIL
jgi:tRNA(Ile)-lysidine synthase